MKDSLTFFVILFVTLLLSCEEKVNPNTELLGRWTWIKSTGGIDGRTETPSITGNQITIEFTNNRYKKYVNGNLETDLGYTIIIGESIFSTDEKEIISFDNDWKQTFVLNEESLLLIDECYDCFQHEYQRE